MSSAARVPHVALVDTHPRILVSASMVLELDGIQVMAATPDLELVTRLCLAGRANVLVIDPHVQPGSSRAVIASLRLQLPDTTIIVMNMESSPAFARVALRAGADAYVVKSQADTELVPAVRQGILGQQFVSPLVEESSSAAGAA